MKGLQAFSERLDRRSARERGLLLAAGLVVLLCLFELLFWAPFREERQRLLAGIAGAEADLAALAVQREEIIARANRDPDLENRRRLEELLALDRQTERMLQQRAGEMISPREMSRVLEELLTRRTGLQLVGLENQPPVSLLPPGSPQVEGKEELLVYRHPLRLTFEGSYLETLGYLRQVESLSRRLFWEELEIEVVDHPRARITLTVFTLSLQRGWLGV